MPAPRATSSLGPLILRLVVGLTFLWTGLGKWYGAATVQGQDAALLANLDILPRTPPAPSTQPSAPTKPLAPAATPTTTPAPAPTSGPSTQSAPPAGILILAQSSPAAPTKPIPVTAGPPLATAADFPDPVSCRAMWRIAILIHHAAHPAPAAAPAPTATTTPAAVPAPTPIWPAVLAQGLWPKILAIAVFVAELGGGICLLLGFFTRLAALSTAGVMLGAMWLTQIGPALQSGKTLLGFLPAHDIWNPQPWTPLAWQLSLLGASLALVCLGSGVLAIDRAIAGYRAVPERFQRPPTSGAPSGAPRQ